MVSIPPTTILDPRVAAVHQRRVVEANQDANDPEADHEEAAAAQDRRTEEDDAGEATADETGARSEETVVGDGAAAQRMSAVTPPADWAPRQLDEARAAHQAPDSQPSQSNAATASRLRAALKAINS